MEHEMLYRRASKSSYTYQLIVLEPNLSNSHTSIFLQIGPRGVDDCDVVLLVTCEALAMCLGLETNREGGVCSIIDSMTFSCSPSILFALVNCAQSINSGSLILSHVSPSGSRT
jgi:hypothetical protein